jgi:hypothetical protein
METEVEVKYMVYLVDLTREVFVEFSLLENLRHFFTLCNKRRVIALADFFSLCNPNVILLGKELTFIMLCG